ncbi:MAG: GTPase and tRNA-U34 5-formylation enzyme TrmE [Micavibrio sp.]|nr:GTPase and tRNA-U34 5-formylation enzyme TrmE [Micavibrio sp.]
MIETIYALASAPGRAGVSVLRVSGPLAKDSLSALSNESLPGPRQATLRTLRSPDSGQPIDSAIVIYFASPASFTGEDVVEYHLHGSPAVIRMLLNVLAAQPGHRLAAPGEFTRRGFENGKMDLTEAEAIADLINAETELQQAQAFAQMTGALGRLYHGWADTLTRALAHLEADLDFPDEDLPDGVANDVLPVLFTLEQDITAHLNDNRRGEMLRDGVHIAIIGAPNAGKSSLINALAQRDVAIVSEHAGTTRDVIEVHMNLGGYPVILADTAGLRPDQLSNDSHGLIEGEGIRRALDRAQNADLKILLFDATLLPDLDPPTKALMDAKSIVVMNKADRATLVVPGLGISALMGQGLDQLMAEIITRIEERVGRRDTPSLTRQRHRTALKECHNALTRAMQVSSPELMAEDVRMALRALGRITGRVDVEDLLDIIFRDFCIGK